MQEGTSSPLPEPPSCPGRRERLRRLASRLKSASGLATRINSHARRSRCVRRPWDLQEPCREPRRERRPDPARPRRGGAQRSEEHTSELQSQSNLVCRLLLEKKKR